MLKLRKAIAKIVLQSKQLSCLRILTAAFLAIEFTLTAKINNSKYPNLPAPAEIFLWHKNIQFRAVFFLYILLIVSYNLNLSRFFISYLYKNTIHKIFFRLNNI